MGKEEEFGPAQIPTLLFSLFRLFSHDSTFPVSPSVTVTKIGTHGHVMGHMTKIHLCQIQVQEAV